MGILNKFLICVVLNLVSRSLGSSLHPSMLNVDGEGKLYAVLVAGSDGWYNYRHQADICHAYQVLHRHGIPDERIIVFMKDDIANDSENPTPGIVINHLNGSDVYKGVLHDYTGETVTPKNFMAVLRGDQEAVSGIGSGRVLQSGPNDHVFVYFADHGAPGLIAFPSDDLTAKDLNKTIHYMHKNKKYGKMVFYIEACESGSMFENILPNNINVYATTAANSEESSYACYFDDERETYLGDTYSVKWMEDSDKEVLTEETLHQQYKIVKKETNESHVQEFGDKKIGKMHVSEFQGRKTATPVTYPKVQKDSVKSRDVPLEIWKRRFSKTNSEEEQGMILKKLNKMYRNRLFLSDKVKEIVKEVYHNEKAVDLLSQHYKLTNFDCYDEVRKHFYEECFNRALNPYALEYMYVLVNMCEKGVSPSRMKAAMERACTHPPVHDIV